MKIISFSLTLLLSILATPSISQTFTSTTQTTQLIELYTSEGCSSCPPADRWLNQLKTHPKLWSEFIPVAFHVDYWDYIGWNDPFANVQFSNRQRQYAREANLSSVYTPGMLLNGKEWTSWRKQSSSTFTTDSALTGKLVVSLEEGIINASYHPTKKQQTAKLVLNIAILGFDVKSVVDAGENNGHTFTHDFVVLGFQRLAMEQNRDGSYTGSLEQLPTLSQSPAKQALSTWVNIEQNLMPIQATGGWITE